MLGGKPVDLGARAGCGLGGARIVGVQHHTIVPVLRGKDALLGQRIVFEGAMPVEMVGRDVQNDRDAGWNCSVLSSWKLETSSTDQVLSVLSSIRPTTGTPMLPATSVGNPASFRISPQAPWSSSCRWIR